MTREELLALEAAIRRVLYDADDPEEDIPHEVIVEAHVALDALMELLEQNTGTERDK